MSYRYQLKRTKGWQSPAEGRKVARPSIFGNPFSQGDNAEKVRRFEEWVLTGPASDQRRARLLRELPKLKGRPLGCFCPLAVPCHADTLLRLANHPLDNSLIR